MPMLTSVTNYDFSEKSAKKDKRWSFGNLFRRKKKPECDSSSDEEKKKKKGNSKRKKNAVAKGFDRVIIPPTRNQHNSFLPTELNVSNNFIPASNFTTKYIPLKDNQENSNGSNKILASPSLNSLGRKKKEVIKARAEARRDHSMGEDSSDEDSSQRSAFRSDESLTRCNDGSLSRKSRAARTQRYLKRRSRDEELYKSDIEHDMFRNGKSKFNNKSDFSGLSTIPPPNHCRYSYKAVDSNNGIIHNNDSNCRRSLSCGTTIINGKSFSKKQPPAPPPRDPKKIHHCDYRPSSYSFENGYHTYSKNGSDQSLTDTKTTSNNYPRSTSEDHISFETSQRYPLVPRSSSAMADTKYLKTPNYHPKFQEESSSSNNGHYCYFADKSPRSRKPISIQPTESQNPQKPFDFWKKQDEISKNSNPESPIMFTAKTQVRTIAFLPNGLTLQTNSANLDDPNRVISPFRPIADDPIKSSSPSIEEQKPSNFEDALDELEAIYNSLHLGDEDLLERAERREAEVAQKRRDALLESFPNSISCGALSDSSSIYDLNPTRRKLKNGLTALDRRGDDMAFRKLNKDRYNTISDPQSITSRISYLLTSPVFNGNSLKKKTKKKSKEPDVTLDDVVYRNVRHNIDTLKIEDPQLPFGIPVGPISPASNSDYLHATPVNTYRSIFKPRKNPDIVKDDLAYRNLRKDPTRDPILPQVNLSPGDYKNNYNNKSGVILRKKKPTRSLSTNIYNLLKPNRHDQRDIEDVADALESSKKILKEKDERINATNKAFMSDGELKNAKSAIDELLSSLDLQTREANEQIANELKICDWEKQHKKALAESLTQRGGICDSEQKYKNALLEESLSTQSKDIKADEMLKELEKDAVLSNLQLPKELDAKSDHTKLCEKLLECVVESTDLLATSKIEPDSPEEVTKIEIEPLFRETLANVVLTTDCDQFDFNNPVPLEIFSEPEHDYVNIQDNQEMRCSSTEIDNEVQELLLGVVNGNGGSEDVSGASPLERHKAELLAVFEELKLSGDEWEKNEGGGEECVSVHYIALPVKEECAFVSEIHFSFDDLVESQIDVDSVQNSNEALSARLEMLHDINADDKCNKTNSSCDLDLERSKQLVKSDDFKIDTSAGSVGINSGEQLNNNQLDSRHTLWYEDPSVIAFACSCGIACTTQLANFDIVAVLGLLFSVILLIMALLARI